VSASDPSSEDAGEDDSCAVCSIPHSYDDDQILFCDGCNVPVHQRCYGVAEVPEGDWFCYTCASDEKKQDPQWQPRCILCPVKAEGHAFMRVFDKDCKPRGDGHQWAHVACAVWVNETAVNVRACAHTHIRAQLLASVVEPVPFGVPDE
jgi:hypothetical protein